MNEINHSYVFPSQSLASHFSLSGQNVRVLKIYFQYLVIKYMLYFHLCVDSVWLYKTEIKSPGLQLW